MFLALLKDCSQILHMKVMGRNCQRVRKVVILFASGGDSLGMKCVTKSGCWLRYGKCRIQCFWSLNRAKDYKSGYCSLCCADFFMLMCPLCGPQFYGGWWGSLQLPECGEEFLPKFWFISHVASDDDWVDVVWFSGCRLCVWADRVTVSVCILLLFCHLRFTFTNDYHCILGLAPPKTAVICLSKHKQAKHFLTDAKWKLVLADFSVTVEKELTVQNYGWWSIFA